MSEQKTEPMMWRCKACGHTFPNPPAFSHGVECPRCGAKWLVSPPPPVEHHPDTKAVIG